MRVVVLLVALLFGCGDNVRGNISVAFANGAEEAFGPVLTEFVALGGYRGLAVRDAASTDAARITVELEASVPREGYRLQQDGTAIVVQASDILGAQYGTAAALEELGFRFRHPFDPYVPDKIATPAIEPSMHQPQIRVRGFQLHTLHPIEGYFAFWEPSPGAVNDARRIIDWVIKNKGNYLQWVALDDILDPARHEAWKALTKDIIDYAHFRGVRVGLNIQLFGQANLQQAFDLSDDRTGMVPIADEIAERLPLITDDLPFDVYDLSFGEFFNANPDAFIAAVNEVHSQLAVKAPQAELHAFVHVGAKQRIEYMGENLIYYFLVKFANPAIIPDIHTVMFYNLYEPAHGAYHHEDFSEHAAYLEARICANQPAAYVPETAYWVAFDVSVPQYYPLYVRNRWLDLAKLKERVGNCGPLDNHTVFQTAWEWGYWMNDVAVMRMSYELPDSYEALLEHALGPDLAAAVPSVAALVELQRDYLMERELVQYVAGRDTAIDAGRLLDIISQPDRVTFEDLEKGADRDALRTTVLEPLATYAGEVERIGKDLAALPLPSSRWTSELRDGVTIDAVRARYAIDLYTAALAHLDGDAETTEQSLASARARLETARGIVKSRHADLHDTHARRLVDRTPNRTYYEYGYLYMADTLCYWRRELVEVENLVTGANEPVPDCLIE